MLQWTWACIYLFKLVFSFSSNKYPEVELLDHMLVLFLKSLHTLLHSSAPIYILINNIFKNHKIGISLTLCNFLSIFSSVQSLSGIQLYNSIDWASGFHVHHQLLELVQTLVHQASDTIQPSHHPLPLSSVFPSIRVFSSESVLCIRWPKYWSFSISPFSEYILFDEYSQRHTHNHINIF